MIVFGKKYFGVRIMARANRGAHRRLEEAVANHRQYRSFPDKRFDVPFKDAYRQGDTDLLMVRYKYFSPWEVRCVEVTTSYRKSLVKLEEQCEKNYWTWKKRFPMAKIRCLYVSPRFGVKRWKP